jgi:hypothetical protein
MEEIVCIPVFYINLQQVVYVPIREYATNPAPDSYVLRERHRYPEPTSWMDLDGSKWRKVSR